RSESRRLEARLMAETRLLKFQALMASLATRCAGAKPDQIDGVIEEVFGELGEAIGVDRCVAHLPAGTNPPTFKTTYRWARRGCDVPAAGFDAAPALPSTIARARDGETMCAKTLDELPDAVNGASLAARGTRPRAPPAPAPRALAARHTLLRHPAARHQRHPRRIDRRHAGRAIMADRNRRRPPAGRRGDEPGAGAQTRSGSPHLERRRSHPAARPDAARERRAPPRGERVADRALDR